MKPSNPLLVEPVEGGGAYSSISLRDLLAGFALAGIVARIHGEGQGSAGPAIQAYDYADAMLQERAK